jgi:PBSX family phage terminase large subunit
VLGEWVAAKGLIYDFFDRAQYVKQAPAEPLEAYVVSVDYGTANPCSFGLWGRRDGVWYRIEEYYYASRRMGVQLTDIEYVEALRHLAAGREVREVVVDPSAASFITALRQAGFRVRRANNDVLGGIRVTANLLKSGKLVICEGCEDLLREIEQYRWSEDRDGRDAPRKENDHAMDDMRYFAATVAEENSGDGAAFYAVER